MRALRFVRRLTQSPFYNIQKPISTTDQTGLVQTIPDDDAQAESYEKLYPIHRQKPK